MKCPTRITLIRTQVEQLKPYVNRVRNSAALGSPGMLLAQVQWDKEGHYWITPAFLDHELAKVITERGRAEIPGAIATERAKRSARATPDARGTRGRSAQ